MRSKEEISTEIKKVKTARKAAVKKLDRCNERLEELYIELEEVVMCQSS
ncbi:hypothetical protein [Aminipila sp.]|nr:hypothetical protein [Aminipila sp.]